MTKAEIAETLKNYGSMQDIPRFKLLNMLEKAANLGVLGIRPISARCKHSFYAPAIYIELILMMHLGLEQKTPRRSARSI